MENWNIHDEKGNLLLQLKAESEEDALRIARALGYDCATEAKEEKKSGAQDGQEPFDTTATIGTFN